MPPRWELSLMEVEMRAPIRWFGTLLTAWLVACAPPVTDDSGLASSDDRSDTASLIERQAGPVMLSEWVVVSFPLRVRRAEVDRP